MKKLQILLLSEQHTLPPEGKSPETTDPREHSHWKTTYDVVHALESLGHEVETLGVVDELAPIRKAIEDRRPSVVFNLTEGFHDEAIFDQHVVSYLELLRQPYTGCNPRGLTLARDKALSKKILAYHRLRAPAFQVFPRGRKIRRRAKLEFPVIVKSLVADASVGIAQASLIHSDDKLAERVEFVHDSLETDAIAEQFIDGRELYVSVLGNFRLRVFPTWEYIVTELAEDAPLIATERAKFDPAYQERQGITHEQARDLSPELERRLARISKRIYRALGLTGYARVDFRLDGEGQPWCLEANPNPEIAMDEEFACSAAAVGVGYEELIQKIVTLGLHRARH